MYCPSPHLLCTFDHLACCFFLFDKYTDVLALRSVFFLLVVVAANMDSERVISLPSISHVLDDVFSRKLDTYVSKLVMSSLGVETFPWEHASSLIVAVVGFLVASYLSMALSVCTRWYTRTRYESAWKEWGRVGLDGFFWAFCIPWNFCRLSRSCLTHTFTNRPRSDQ